MKKVMIGILIFVPIMILAIVATVSTILISAAFIGVEDIHLEFKDKSQKVLTLQLQPDVYNLNDYLKVAVEPLKATDKTFVWRIEGLCCLDDDYTKRYNEYMSKSEYTALDRENAVLPSAMLIKTDERGADAKDRFGGLVPSEENRTGKLKINAYCSFEIVVATENCSARATVFVGDSARSLVLGTTSESLACGIARETVFGSRVYANAESADESGSQSGSYGAKGSNYQKVANRIPIEIAVPAPPHDSASAEEKAEFYSAFDFTVDEAHSELAYFEENSNVLILRPENIDKIKGKTKLTVTVKSKLPKVEGGREYAEKSVDISVTRGIHITTDMPEIKEPPVVLGSLNESQMLVSSQFQLYNMQLFNQLKAVEEDAILLKNQNEEAFEAGELTFPAITLGRNIRLPDMGEGSFTDKNSIQLFGDLYGNNHRIAGGFREIDGSSNLIIVRGDGVTISNIILRANTLPNGYEMTSSKNKGNNLTGYALSYRGDAMQRERCKNCRIEFSVIENAKTALALFNADVVAEGSIIRNTTQSAIYIQTEINSVQGEGDKVSDKAMYSNLTLKNCVMSNMLGTGMSVCYQHYGELANGNPRANVREFLERGENSTFTQQGFLDVYNWQPIESAHMIETGSSEIDDFVAGVIGDAMSRDTFARFRAVSNNTPYAHLGFITLGLKDIDFEPTYLITSFEDKRFKKVSSNLLLQNSIALPFLDGNEIFMYLYDKESSDILPDTPLPYSNGRALINKLHGGIR